MSRTDVPDGKAMIIRAMRTVVVLILAILGPVGCPEPEPVADGDSDGDADWEADAEVESDADGEGDTAPDGDGDAVGGALLLVARAVMVAADRRCDIDGDGAGDNAVAELGAEGSAMFTLAINGALSSTLDTSRHPLFHFRWIDDLSGPTTAAAEFVVTMGVDSDWPYDPSDDLSGHEPLYWGSTQLDPNGEPFSRGASLSMEGGVASGSGGTFPLPVADASATISIAQMGGAVAPWGATFELWLCGSLRVHDVGGVPLEMTGMGELSVLEWLLAGGAAFGLETVPGLRPDLDLDGDGLESFVIDADGRIEQCIDGDRTVIDGRGCWQDSRMADAFSLTFDFTGVSATFAGREPAWEYRVPAGGHPLPREESFFSTVLLSDGACAGLDALCDPRLPEPCCDPSHLCSGADRRDYRCFEPCEPSPCSYGARLGACVFHGDLPDPTCTPVGPPFSSDGCEPAVDRCTTSYGASFDTVCFVTGLDSSCVERCEPAAPSCGDGHRCVPRAFEPGGLCALWEHAIPTD